MKTIRDEKELDAPEAEGGQCYYLRLKHEPTLCIHSRTGELYARADGQPWQEGGYFVARKKDGSVEWRPANGYCDLPQYRYAERAA